MRRSVSKVFEVEVYLWSLTTWLLINSIRFVSLSKMSQIVSIGFGIWGIVILLNNVFNEKGTIFTVPGVGLGIVFIFTVAISFICNGMKAPVKNIYTIIAVCINFLIIYTSPFLTKDNSIKKILEIIVIGSLILNIINLVLLYLRYTYIIGDLEYIRQATFIGFDSLRGRFTGLSGNANGLSRLALNGLLASGALIVLDKKRKNRGVYFTSLVVNILVVLLAQSRGSIYSLALAIGVSISIYIYLRLKNNNSHKIITALILSVVFILSSVTSLKLIDKVSYMVVDNYPKVFILSNGNGSNNDNDDGKIPSYDLSGRDDEATNEDFSNGRLTLIENGIKATLEYNPLFGLSYAGATEKIQNYITDNEITVPLYLFNSAGQMHNTIVQSFVYYGFLGLLALCVFFIYIVISFIKFIISKEPISSDQISKIVVVVFAAAVMVAMNMVEWVFVFDFDNHLINLVFFVVLGSLISELFAHSEQSVECKLDSKVRSFFGKLFQ